MGKIHIVRKGEYLSLIARNHGFADWRKIYNHADNAEFRMKRPNPDILFAGDTLIIPDCRPRSVDLQTGKRHRFRLKRPSPALHLTLKDSEGEPLGPQPYRMEVAGRLLEGNLTDAGKLEVALPGGAREAKLTVFLDAQRRQVMSRMALKIGELDPIDEVTGMQERLNNLGFECGQSDGRFGSKTRSAVKAFQQKQGLEPNGEADQATLDRLQEVYGC